MSANSLCDVIEMRIKNMTIEEARFDRIMNQAISIVAYATFAVLAAYVVGGLIWLCS